MLRRQVLNGIEMSRQTNIRRITFVALSMLIASTASLSNLSISGLTTATLGNAAQAASTSRVESLSTTTTGLDAKTLQLANRGLWSDVIERLKTQTEGATSPTLNHGWLAFGEMFLDKCDDLKSLSSQVQAMPAAADSGNISKTVEVFSLLCQKKYNEAQQLAKSINSTGNEDVLLNLALAAVAAKRGDAAQAIVYCQKVCTLAPDFSWGYRTLGYIQQRSLKDNAAAEKSFEQALAISPESKEVRDLLSDLHLGRYDFDGALDIAQSAVKINPRDPNNYYRLSQIYTQQWRLREADQQLDKAIRLTPDNARFHRAKASILRWQGNLVGAITEQEKAVNLSTDKSFELTELAALNELAGNESAAADNLRQALSLANAGHAAHQAAHLKLVQLLTKGKRYDDLAVEYRRAISIDPKQGSLHFGLAEALLKTNKTDEAVKEATEAANLDNNDPRPHRLLGALYLTQKNYTAAARFYTKALNLNPGNVDDLLALASTYEQADDYMQAEAAFRVAFALQQLTQTQATRIDVMRSFANLLLREGRYADAAESFKSLSDSAANPSQPQDNFLLSQSNALRDCTAESITQLITTFEALPEADRAEQRPAVVDALIKLGKTDLALNQLEKAAAPTQQQPQWLALAARTYRAKGDLTKAEELANKAVAASSENNKEILAGTYIDLAQVLLQKGNLNAADVAIRKATELNSKSFLAYEVMGRIYMKRNDFEHAIEAAKHALEINPYFTPGYVLTGDAYAASNKLDQAANNYKRAVELYPTSLDAHRGLRDVYKKLAHKEEAQKEDELIAQMEKRS